MDIDGRNIEKRLAELEMSKNKRVGTWPERNPIIRGVASNSKEIRDDYIFFAINGCRGHGANFTPDAIRRGANLVVTDYDGHKILTKKKINVPTILAENPRKTLATYSTKWYERQPQNQIAITGTNGKTSVCHFVRQIWELLGFKAANIGTLGVQGAIEMKLSNTTPEPVILHKILRYLVDSEVQNVSMEASSHGLSQFRLDGVNLKAAAFTNLTRDHLDYHKDEDDYFRAKCDLFERILPKGRVVVVNIDDPYADLIKVVSRRRDHRLITVGYKEGADIRIYDQRFYPGGQSISFSYMGLFKTIDLTLIGDFQATNILMAAALVIALGGKKNRVLDSLERLQSVPGRMHLVEHKEVNANVFVDYAHTPDALAKALKALRLHTTGNLTVVFGAGGDRDIGKRSLMGAAAHELADKVIVTDDNPRKESPFEIRKGILKECPNAEEIPDRAVAILTAIKALRKGDVLLIAGKGHETGQIIGDDILPFNDIEVASMSISLLNGKNI